MPKTDNEPILELIQSSVVTTEEIPEIVTQLPPQQTDEPINQPIVAAASEEKLANDNKEAEELKSQDKNENEAILAPPELEVVNETSTVENEAPSSKEIRAEPPTTNSKAHRRNGSGVSGDVGEIVEVTLNTKHQQKYCADVKQIKQLFSDHIDPIYMPLIHMLPDDFQLMLLDETQFAGLSRASCLFLSIVLLIVMSVWYTLSRLAEAKRLGLNVRLNEQLLASTNKINRLEFENKTFANLIADLEAKQARYDILIEM